MIRWLLAMARKTTPSGLPADKEYERLNPGAEGTPSQMRERRAKTNPRAKWDEAGIPGSQNADLKGRKPKGRLKPPA